MAVLMSLPYTLTAPDGTVAVINDATSASFVGYLTEPPSGIDGPPVRERAQTKVDGHGGAHGPFLWDRRPIALAGMIPPSGAQALDEARQNRVLAASKALASDLALTWTEAVRGPLLLLCRTQQPTRIANRLPKTFAISAVSADHRIVGGTIKLADSWTDTTDGLGNFARTFQIHNAGNAEADWRLDLTLAGAATVTRFAVELFSDSGFSQLISRTEYNGPVRSGAGNDIYVIAGRPPSAGAGYNNTLQNAIGDATATLTKYTVFHPLNFAPARAGGTTWGRVILYTSTGAVGTAVSYRDSWDQ